MKAYVTVNGEIKKYDTKKYLRSQSIHKPNCPSCSPKTQGRVVMNVIVTGQKNRRKRLGWFCPICEKVFINLKYKSFRIRELGDYRVWKLEK